MERLALPAFLIAAGSLPAQPVLITGFESNGLFDLTGVSTYCSLADVQGSNDTPGGGSIWSAAIPATFGNSCPPPAITQGLFFLLPAVNPGQHVGITFRHKVPTSCALGMNILYVDPAGAPLPASEQELGFPEIGFYEPGAGNWNIFSGSFDVPTFIPWPSDLYLVIRYFPAGPNSDAALIDNIEVTADPQLGWGTTAAILPAIRIAPQPASDHISITGLNIAGNSAEAFSATGATVSHWLSRMDRDTWDVHLLPSGLYVLDLAGQHIRFIKD